jgi:hypothetical protein
MSCLQSKLLLLVGIRDLRTLWSPPVSLNQEIHTQRRKAAIFIFILFIFCLQSKLLLLLLFWSLTCRVSGRTEKFVLSHTQVGKVTTFVLSPADFKQIGYYYYSIWAHLPSFGLSIIDGWLIVNHVFMTSCGQASKMVCGGRFVLGIFPNSYIVNCTFGGSINFLF